MRAPTEFVYKGFKYQIRHMNAVDQCILAGRVSPLIMPVMSLLIKEGIVTQIASLDFKTSEGRATAIELALGSFEIMAQAISTVPPDEMRIVYNTCLKHLIRQGGEAKSWQTVLDPSVGTMFDDLEGIDVMVLSIKVIQDQLGNFIKGALSDSVLGLLQSTTKQ